MRKQYYFRPSEHGYYAWDVDRLIVLSSDIEPQQVSLSRIVELDQPFQLEGSGDIPTYRDIAMHAKLIGEADLRFPIIISSTGQVMDGMHRVMKALNTGLTEIEAVVFETDPEPDHKDVLPDDLPY